jgi:hypothetical protein
MLVENLFMYLQACVSLRLHTYVHMYKFVLDHALMFPDE